MKYALSIFRWAISLLFIAAGAVKLWDPAAFHGQIETYRVVTGTTARLIAVYLPWLELAAGAGLLITRWARLAAALLLGLVVTFLIMLLAAILRGLDVDCGCFGVLSNWPVSRQLVADVLIAIGLIAILACSESDRRALR